MKDRKGPREACALHLLGLVRQLLQPFLRKPVATQQVFDLNLPLSCAPVPCFRTAFSSRTLSAKLHAMAQTHHPHHPTREFFDIPPGFLEPIFLHIAALRSSTKGLPSEMPFHKAILSLSFSAKGLPSEMP